MSLAHASLGNTFADNVQPFEIFKFVNLPFVTSAHSRSSAFPVATTIFANGYALFALDPSETFGRGLNHVSFSASAYSRCHALAIFTATGADRLAVAVFFFVAQFTSAHVRREAIGVLLAWLFARGHADALLCNPAWRTGAYVWSSAFST